MTSATLVQCSTNSATKPEVVRLRGPNVLVDGDLLYSIVLDSWFCVLTRGADIDSRNTLEAKWRKNSFIQVGYT